MDCKTEESYPEALRWLFSQLPMFSRIGAAAYKPGLETTLNLDRHFGHPHTEFKSIHIGGTNGKGSTSHMLASVLQAHGYKVGLYTSPHLVDFRERIRIDGTMIPEDAVVDFVERWRHTEFDGHPSFFELTMMMAFDWFAKEKVDYAVIEVGMGGRLDSTNVITPIMSVITNISKDHTQFLGDTLAKIAGEKAGIIKTGIPVVVGETLPETLPVFLDRASEVDAPVILAEEDRELLGAVHEEDGTLACETRSFGKFRSPLGGEYQKKNINTVLSALKVLRDSCGIMLEDDKIREGLENVVNLTGLMGRWQIYRMKPTVICDTGHNFAGLTDTMAQLNRLAILHPEGKIRMVIGFVNDKDVSNIVSLFPSQAEYYFTQAAIPRAMPVDEVCAIFSSHYMEGRKFPIVVEAYDAALHDARPEDIIYVGGSTFIVADFLASRK